MNTPRVVIVRDTEVLNRLEVLNTHFGIARTLPNVLTEKLLPFGVTAYREYGFMCSNVAGEILPLLGGKEWDMLFEFDLQNGCMLTVALHYTASYLDDNYPHLGLHPRLREVAGYIQCGQGIIPEIDIVRLLRAWHQLIEPDAKKRRTTATQIVSIVTATTETATA